MCTLTEPVVSAVISTYVVITRKERKYSKKINKNNDNRLSFLSTGPIELDTEGACLPSRHVSNCPWHVVLRQGKTPPSLRSGKVERTNWAPFTSYQYDWKLRMFNLVLTYHPKTLKYESIEYSSSGLSFDGSVKCRTPWGLLDVALCKLTELIPYSLQISYVFPHAWPHITIFITCKTYFCKDADGSSTPVYLLQISSLLHLIPILSISPVAKCLHADTITIVTVKMYLCCGLSDMPRSTWLFLSTIQNVLLLWLINMLDVMNRPLSLSLSLFTTVQRM